MSSTIFSLILLLISSCGYSAASLDNYFDYLNRYPDTLGVKGSAALGEIEIVRDRQKIAEVEQSTGRRVGIVAIDKYWTWINDVVKFPNQKYGVYGRIIQSAKGRPGVAVLPLLPNGKIVLNRNYRHATRSWEYELPRGGIEAHETAEAAATREVKEETGMVIDTLIKLGEMAPDSGVMNSIISIYCAQVTKEEESTPEEAEAIAAVEAFTIEELKMGFLDGFLSVTADGKISHIPLRDPFLAFALFQADLRSLVPQSICHKPDQK